MPDPNWLEQSGPVRDPASGQTVFLVRERMNLDWKIRESPTPTNVKTNETPPECWIRQEFERRNVLIETYRVHKYKAAKKTNWLFWTGVVLLVGATILTGGAAALAWGAAAATTAATTAIVGVKAAVLLGAATLAGTGGYKLVKNPDEWEISAELLETLGPFENELNWTPLAPRVVFREIPCDRPITGEDIGSGGTGSGDDSSGSDEKGASGAGD